MTGGIITKNEANREFYDEGYGGGVFITSGTYDMSGGTVTVNTADTDGNNVYIRDDSAINPGDDAVIDGGLYSEDYTTVCFYSNVNGDDTDEMTSQIIKKGEYVPLKLNEFTREGYDFNGWNTKADGSGEVYADGASVYVDKSVYEDLNLYALWAEPHQDHDKQDDSTCSLHKGWIAWTETETLPNETGYYFLTKDVMLAEIWMAPPAVTHLCLNGHKIIQSADESAVIYVSSDATLYLYDLTENSGVITHLKDDDGVRTGEGVLVEGGIFNMNGGSISGNEAVYDGGGIYVNGGEVTVSGGKITDNKASGDCAGGGIYLDGGELTISDGVISGNEAGTNGGGVCVNEGTLNMSGGTVTGNTSKSDGNNVYIAEDNEFNPDPIEKPAIDGGLYSEDYTTVCFNANGGGGEMRSQVIPKNTETALRKNTFTLKDCVLKEWNTKADGSGESYADEDKVNVSSDEGLILYAQWVPANYTITFVDGDGTQLQSGDVAYNTVPKYTGTKTPTKAPDAEYSYTFAGWTDGTKNYGLTEDLPAATKAVTYKPVFTSTVNEYEVTFVNDGKVLQTLTVPYGQSPAYTEATPVRTADAQYTYTFDGWKTGSTTYGKDAELPTVTGAITYTAVYNNTINEYTITFVSDDNVISSESYPYGTSAEKITPADPTKEATAKNTFTFTGWSPVVTDVTGEATYTAQFSSTVNEYTVTFVSDGNVISSESYPYGTSADTIKPEDPTKAPTAQYTYKFEGWDKEITDVTGNATYTAQFSSTVNEYTVTFISDGKVISATDYPYGTAAADITVPDDPTKAPTAQYTYKFEGWTPAIEAVTGDATYTAQFSSTVNEYTVTFVSEGKTISTKSYPYGTVAADIEKPADPKKAPTAQYTYKFEGWTPEITMVTKDATYTAEFSSTVNEYTVTFVSEGKTISTKSYPYGTAAADIVKPADPSKEATAEFTYKFESWTPAIADVTGDATYTAVFSSTVNEYTITFVNEGEVISAKSYPYGTAASAITVPADPSKEATAQYTYVFAGWTPEIATVTKDATYTATYKSTVNEYTIKFVDEDGTVLQTSKVAYGETPAYAGETPTKESTDEATFVFFGWNDGTVTYSTSDTLPKVTGDAVYTAVFADTTKEYEITFVDDEGNVLQTIMVLYGEVPAYSEKVPTKEATAQYTYTFSGWNDGKNTYGVSDKLPAVTGDVTYKAVFESTVNEYTITFLNGDGSVLMSIMVPYGETPVYTGDTPVKEADVQYTYSFAGWTPEIVSVTGDAAYTAVFSSTVNEYTVTFISDGKVISSKAYPYGTEASDIVVPEAPTIAPTVEFTYTFEGWTPEIADVTGDATYTAEFSSKVNEYTVSFVDEDGTELQSVKVPYGQTPAYTGENPTKDSTDKATFAFVGWTDGTITYSTTDTLPKVTGDAVYTAVYADTTKEYKITFIDDEGIVLQTIMVLYGNVPAYTGNVPSKEATAQYTYTFIGWNDGKNTYGVSDKLPSVIGDATYTAMFMATVNEYKITFVNEDGTVLQTGKVAYGETPAFTGTTPSKNATAQYTYTFSGWTPEITKVTADATYTATYKATVNKYEIKFVDDTGRVLSSKEYEYGTKAEDIVKPADPVKASTAQYSYTFEGWTPAIADVTGDATYTAVFIAIAKPASYYLKILKGDGLGGDIVAVFGRTIDDANAISYLDRVEADDKVLTKDKEYTAEAGSVIITLKKEYLDTISEGKHTLTVYFKDDQHVTLEFTVKHITNESENIPSTGEKIAKTLFIGGACVLLAAAAAGTVIVIKKKRKKEDA